MKGKRLAIFIGVALLGSSHLALGGVLLSDNFNTENGGVGTFNYSTLANFNITRGSIDLIGNGFFDFLPGHGLYLDLDGTTLSAARLESKTSFAFATGDSLSLQFLLAGSQRGDTNTVTVSLGTLYSEVFTLPGSAPFSTVTRSIPVPSATTARLVFDHQGGDNVGLLLDDVSLSSGAVAGSPVPEPSTLLLTLGILPLLIRRAAKSANPGPSSRAAAPLQERRVL